MSSELNEGGTSDVTPIVPGEIGGPEFSLRAVVLGIVLAAILGAANAYLGLKAGMTVSATFPAAVIAIAAFRLPFFRGGVLEQNIARTAATVGEALVAAAIFTLPAFVMVDLNGARLWTSFNYWQSAIILLIGGLLGIFFIVVMRRTLTVDAKLPFPESYACYELVKAGQGGETGAKYVFGAMGLGMLIELFKNERGLMLVRAVKEALVGLPGSQVHVPLSTPVASPAILGVGYIIGPRYASITFSGGVLAWLVFLPFALLAKGGANVTDWAEVAYNVWRTEIRPVAVGAMLVASFYTLWGLRTSIIAAFRGVFHTRAGSEKVSVARRERDLSPKLLLGLSVLLTVPMGFIFHHWTHNLLGTIVACAILLFIGFLLSIIGGWIVGLIGSSNQPVSGITLAALITSGVIFLLIKMTGLGGVAAALGIAVVICSAAALSGTLIQELKVGHMLGATPWKMQLAQIVSTIVVAFVVVYPMMILHESNIATGGMGIGDKALPAPQAGLMANVATGIISGEISWNLIGLGMAFAIALIMMGVPSPMVIAVGMYLPFDTTFAIFAGGVMKWLLDWRLKRHAISSPLKEKVENTGVLLASGFIAGEAITGVVVAGLVMFFLRLAELAPSRWGSLADSPSLTMFLFGKDQLPFTAEYSGWLAIAIFALVAAAFIWFPLRKKA